MSQIEVSKAVAHVYTAPSSDEIAVSKTVLYLWAVPGESSGGGDTTAQGHVYAQKITR